MDEILDSFDQATVYRQLEETVDDLLSVYPSNEASWFLQNSSHLRRAARTHGLPLSVFKRLVISLLGNLPVSSPSVVTDEGSNGSTHAHAADPRQIVALAHAFRYSCEHLQDQLGDMVELDLAFKRLFKSVEANDKLRRIVINGFRSLAENRCINDTQTRALLPNSASNNQQRSIGPIFGCSTTSQARVLTRTQSRTTTRIRNTVSDHHHSDSMGVSRDARTGASQNQERAREPGDSDDVLGSDRSIWRDNCGEAAYLRTLVNDQSYKFKTADIRWLEDTFLARPDWFKRATVGVATIFIGVGVVPYVQGLCGAANRLKTFTSMTIHIVQTLEILSASGRLLHENVVKKLFECLMAEWDGAMGEGKDHVPPMFEADIKTIRLCALQILLNSRACGLDIMETEREARHALIRGYMTHEDLKFREVATNILASYSDEAENYEQTFETCLNQLTAEQANMNTLKPMLVSASQWSRAQHLFNDERLKTINTILTAMSRPNEPYDMNFKAKCAEIIYTYVEHKEHEEGLMLDVEGTLDAIGNLLISKNMSPEYEKGLLDIIDIVFKRKRRTGLQTIVSSVQKILDVVVQRLISSIDGAKDSMDPSNRLLAVIIICRGVGLKPIGLGASTQIKPGQFGQFSKALLETLDDVQGQENKEPNLLLAFSLICLRCFQHGHGRQCTEQLLSRLLAIVNSPCSRTDEHYESKTAARLEASNAIYEAIQQNSNLASIHLLDLCTAIIQPDELPQVRCFCSLAYLSGLRQLARSSSNVGCVTQADLSILPFIMQLRFDEDQWMSVKDHVLYLLEYLMDPASTSTPREPLEEALFSSINTILAEQSSEDEIRVVKFLETYTRMFALPPATADALESICQKPDLREPILEIYRNVVKLGEPIPDFALQEVVNLLFASVAEALDAFDQLQTIDQRQELPTSLFRLLEMERARIVYKTSSNVEHKTAALQFITRCVQEHRSRLSSLIFQDVVRSIVLADEPTLKLLYYAVENEHADRAVTKLSRRILQEWNTAFGSSSQDDTMPTLLKLICLISRKGDLLSSDATTVAASIASKLSSEKNFDHCNRLLVVTYLVVIGEASQTIESATLEPVLRRMIDGTWDKECISNLVVAVLALNGELDPDLMSGLVKVLVHSALNKQTDALTGLLRLLRERKITHISMDHLNMLLRIPKTISTEDKGMINFAVSYGNLLNYAKDNETVCMDLQEETRTDLEILGLICIEEDAEFCQRIEGFVDKFSPFHWIRCMKILDSADEEVRQRLVDILHGFEPTWPNSIVRSVRKHLRAGQLENNVTSVEEKYRFASTIQSTEQLRPEDINACIQYLIKKAYSSAEFPAAEVNDFFAKLPSSAIEPGSDRLIQLGALCATIVLVDLSRRQITKTVVDVLENCITYQATTYQATEVDVTVLDAYCLLLKDAATQERCAFRYKTEQVLVALVALLTRSDQSYDLRFHLIIETVLECCRLDQREANIVERAVLQPNLLAFLFDTLDSSGALTRALIFDHLRFYLPQVEEEQLQERFKIWCKTRLKTIRQSDISHQLGRRTPQPPDELDLLRAYMSVSVTHPLNLLSADNYTEDLIFLDLISIYGLNMGSRFDLLQKWGSLKTSFDDPHTVLRLLFTNICKYGLTYNRAHELLDIMTQIPKAETMNILSISGQFCLEMMKCVFWKRARDPEKLPNLSIAELKFFSLRLLKQVRNIPEMYPNTNDSVTVGILQLVLKYRLNEEEIPYDDDPVEFLYNLKILIAAKYLHPKTRHKLLGNRLGVGLRRLIEKMEDFDQILGLFEVVKARADETKSKRILGVLAHLMHQGCAANVHRVEDRLHTLCDDPSTWVEATDKFVMEHHFEDKRNVEGADYFEGLSGIPALKDLFGLQDSKALQQYLQRAVSKIAGGESAPPLTRTNASAGRFLVKNMRPSEIEEWVIEIMTLDPATLSDNVVHGILSVLNRGLSLRMNKRLKTLQIVSCLAAVKAFQTGKEGLLQQIATGCGKSAIIGTLATFHGIFGRQVDIVTSSSVLAARDAKEFNPMYKLFGLSADHNGDAGRYTRGAKSCYRCPIVYGEAAQFQFDLLRQEYSELGTLGTRSLNTIVLVDEVDSMLIDDSSKIARLASSCAGMNEFQPMYHLIWNELQDVLRCSVPLDGLWYLFNGELDLSDGQFKYKYKNQETGEEETIDNLADFVRDAGEGADQIETLATIGLKLIQEASFDDFVRQHLQEFITKIGATEGGGAGQENRPEKVKIPSSLRKLAFLQTPKWIDSAMKALDFSEEKEYVIDGGLVKPVDFFSTGQILCSTQWSDALQEMLQLKHGLALTSETCTTNFMSNVAFFRRYESRIFGFTGTLGSAKAQGVLADVYKVGLLRLPKHFQGNYAQLESIVAVSQDAWLQEIKISAMIECQRKRGVLIICADIETANNVYALITTHEVRRRGVRGAKLYSRNNANQERDVQSIQPGHVIVATNLAGRGTDIATSNIEAYGGLHVCVTFLPDNERVEAQAFGRTARQNNTGTGQLIILHSGAVNMTLLHKLRDEKEREELDAIQATQLVQIEAKDRLFTKFCKDLKHIRQQIRRSENLGARDRVGNIFCTAPSIYEVKYTEAVEAEWALLLKQVDGMELDELKSQALMDARYEAFAGLIRAVYDKQRSGNAPRTTSSPFPLICIGNYLLSIDGYLEARVKEAIMFFDKAIEMDEEFCAGALVGKACCLLKGDTNWFGVNSHDFGYKEEAVKLLQKAETQIMYSMNILYVLGQQLQTNAESGQAGSHSTNLKNQLLQKVTLLGTYLNSVRNAIAVVQRSRRLLHVEWKEENDPGYTTKYDLDPQSQETQDFLLQLQTNSVDLIFNDLIVRNSGLEELKAAASKGAACVTVPDKFPTQTEIVKAAPKAIGAIVGAVVSNNETDQAVKTLEKYEDETSTATIQLRLKNPSPSQLESLIKALRLLQRGQYALGLQLNFEFKSLAMSAVKKMVNGTEEFQQEVKFSLDIFGERDDEAIGALQLQTEKLVLFKDKVKNTATWKPSDFNGRDESVDPHRLRIECSTSQQVSQVLDCCMPINTFGLKIASLDLAKASTLFEEACCLKTVTLSGLTKAEATRLIPELRKVGFNFALVFKGLSIDNASKLVENSATEQEHIMLRNLKPLSECFAAQERATLVTELSEYAALGVECLPEFSESAFIPWFHIITVCGLAAAQVAIGIGLMTFGFVRFGSGFLAEAAADLFTAYRTYTTRHFSWNSYFNQKAVSLVISIVSAGISRSVRGIQGTGTAIQTVRTGAVEFGVTKLVTGSGVKQASRGQLTKLAVQSLGVKVIEAGAREGFNKGVDTLFDYGIRFLEPKLSEKVFQPQIRALVNGQREIRFLIRKMYAIDTQLNQQLLLHSIETTIAFVTSSSLWDSIGLQLARSVLSDSDNMGSGASAAVKIVGLCNGSYEVSTLCAKLEKNLRARLEQYDNQHLGMTSLIKMATAVQIPAASASRQPSANELLRDESHAQMLSRLEQIEVIVDSIQTSETKKKLLHFFSNIHNICHAQEDVKRDLFVSTIIKTLSDRVTDKVIRVVETQMLAPWTTELVAHTVGSVSHSLQQWAHGGFTIRQVLDREAQRYWTHKARQQIQQAVLIQTNQSLTQSQLMLSKYTDAVVAGRDAGLTEITQLASKYGTRLTIVTEGDYQPVAAKRNFDSVVVCKTGPDGVTQYELHQNGATPVTYNNGFDMCGKIFGKPVGELRREIVADVPKRADAYVAALNAESWIANCYPAAAQEAILASQPLNRLSVGGTFGLPGLVTFDNLLNLQRAVPFAEAIREGINEGYAIFNPGTPEVTPALTTEGVQATPPPQEPEGQMAEGAQALQLELEPEAAPESMPPDLDTPQPTSEADRARVLLLLALLCLSLSIIVAVGTFYLGSASVRPGQISGESFGQRFNQLEGANQVDEL